MSAIDLTEEFNSLVDTASQMIPIACDVEDKNPGSDISVYLNQDLYFKLLQDDGSPWTKKEKVQHGELQALKPKKAVTRRMNIFSKGRFYPLLYKLGKELGDLYIKKKDSYFKNMNPQSCYYTKYIAEYILQKRYKLDKADIHKSPCPENTSLSNNEEYQGRTHFFLLPQNEVLQ